MNDKIDIKGKTNFTATGKYRLTRQVSCLRRMA